MWDMTVYETEFSFRIAVRNVSYAFSIFLKDVLFCTYDNVFYFSVRVSSKNCISDYRYLQVYRLFAFIS